MKGPTVSPHGVMNFSSEIQQALVALSSQYGSEITGAYNSAPALVNDLDDPTEVRKEKALRDVEDNKLAIKVDMAILERALQEGQHSRGDIFKAYHHLGKHTYLYLVEDLFEDDEDGKTVPGRCYEDDDEYSSCATYYGDDDYDDNYHWEDNDDDWISDFDDVMKVMASRYFGHIVIQQEQPSSAAGALAIPAHPSVASTKITETTSDQHRNKEQGPEHSSMA